MESRIQVCLGFRYMGRFSSNTIQRHEHLGLFYISVFSFLLYDPQFRYCVFSCNTRYCQIMYYIYILSQNGLKVHSS